MKRNRKKLIFKILLTLICWVFTVIFVIKYPPEDYYLPGFFGLMGISLLLTFSLMTKFSLTLMVGCLGILLLRYFRVMDMVNFAILAAMVLSIGLYQYKS